MGTVPALLTLAAILLVTLGVVLGWGLRGEENAAIRKQADRRRAAVMPVRAVATVIDAELVDGYAIEGAR